MRIFVFHEFHNSSRNTDAYDTISSHRGAVFVPFYMSKTAVDAEGRRFVVVVQVAPYDVVSVHATNRGSAGPGIEVAKNATDDVEPLQSLAGVLVATMVKTAEPRLDIVNHRGREGLAMLSAYEARQAALARRSGDRPVRLPFVPAAPRRVAGVTAALHELIAHPGASRPIAVAERAFVPQQSPARSATSAIETPARRADPPVLFTAASAMPRLIGPIRLARRPGSPPPVVDVPRLVAPIQPAVRPTRRGGGAS